MVPFMRFLIRLRVSIPASHTSLPDCPRKESWGRSILAEPLLLPGIVPGFTWCPLSSSPALQTSARWREPEWSAAEQINNPHEGMWGMCCCTDWMLCARRGKSKWKAHASEGQQPGPFDYSVQSMPGKYEKEFCVHSGTKVRSQLTSVTSPSRAQHWAKPMETGWWPHVQTHLPAGGVGQAKSLQCIQCSGGSPESLRQCYHMVFFISLTSWPGLKESFRCLDI